MSKQQRLHKYLIKTQLNSTAGFYRVLQSKINKASLLKFGWWRECMGSDQKRNSIRTKTSDWQLFMPFSWKIWVGLFYLLFFPFSKEIKRFFFAHLFSHLFDRVFRFFFLKLKSAENFFFLISSVWREIDKLCYTILTNLISFGHFEFGGVMNPEKLLIPQVVSLCD